MNTNYWIFIILIVVFVVSLSWFYCFRSKKKSFLHQYGSSETPGRNRRQTSNISASTNSTSDGSTESDESSEDPRLTTTIWTVQNELKRSPYPPNYDELFPPTWCSRGLCKEKAITKYNYYVRTCIQSLWFLKLQKTLISSSIFHSC